MGVFPCDWGMHRFPQAQQAVYLTSVTPVLVQTQKVRLCPKHFRECVSRIAETMPELAENWQDNVKCMKCGERRDGSIYARCFPRDRDELLYGIDLCVSCCEQLLDDLRDGLNWRAMPTRDDDRYG